MFEQAVLPIEDEAHFAEVKASLEPLFASGNVAGFLKQVQRAKLRVRDFEGLLAARISGRRRLPKHTGRWAIPTAARCASCTCRWWSMLRRSCEQVFEGLCVLLS